MNEQDNKSSAEQQAEKHLNELRRSHDMVIYNATERAYQILLHAWHLTGDKRLGSHLSRLADDIDFMVDPYSSDDLDDTQPPKEAA